MESIDNARQSAIEYARRNAPGETIMIDVQPEGAELLTAGSLLIAIGGEISADGSSITMDAPGAYGFYVAN